MSRAILLLLFVSFLTLICSCTSLEEPEAEYISSSYGTITVKEEFNRNLDISRFAKVLSEKLNSYTANEVLTGSVDSFFVSGLRKEHNSRGSVNFWVKLKFRSELAKPAYYILQTDKRHPAVSCYIVNPDNKIELQKSGWSVPPSHRLVKSSETAFRILLESQKETIVYLHIQANEKYTYAYRLSLSLSSDVYWNKMHQSTTSFLWFYAGVSLLAVFYWLITFIYSLRINYLYLIAATFSFLILYLDRFGITAMLFWPEEPLYTTGRLVMHTIGIPFVAIANSVLFAKLNHLDKNYKKGLQYLFWVSCYGGAALAIISSLIFYWKYTSTITMIYIIYGDVLIFSLLADLWIRKKNRSAGFALFAYIPAMCGILLLISDKLNIMAPLGALVTVVLLFYGMVDYVRILRLKREREHLEKERLIQEQNIMLEQKVEERTSELELEKVKANELLQKSDDLLLNILPAEIADELKYKGQSNAKTYSLVTVMFIDFKDFTTVGEKVSAELLVAELDYCFSKFDEIVQRHGIEKIKTVGDAYICAGGLPLLTYTHARDTVRAALEIIEFMEQRKLEKEAKREIAFEARIGIHSGPVVAGIVGKKKFAFDIWGDTVNTAARMEQNSEAGKINISGATHELIKDEFKCNYRGEIKAKNKGMLKMYFVN